MGNQDSSRRRYREFIKAYRERRIEVDDDRPGEAPDHVTIVNSPVSSTDGRPGAKSVAFERMNVSWMLIPSRVMFVKVVRIPLMVVS